MATIQKWTPFGVALDITATAGTVTRTSATQFTVRINASWETYYNGAGTNYGMTASSGGASATINTFGKAASSGSGSFTGTYSISGNGSASKTISVTFRNFNNDNGDSATKNISLAVTVPAWTSYKVQYSANGGTGAPSAQTKWKDQTLKLSTTKPTRTGYSFQGWATSSTATTAAYQPGSNYTANSAVTLHAVWKANTYTVTYNANGGTGAPAKQTKTYNTTLTLSSTKPTRANYNFLGWGTSASATTVSYKAGANYTANAAITLYAIWELAYQRPRITELAVARCDSAGVIDPNGTYAVVNFNWACDLEVVRIRIDWSDSISTNYSLVTASGTNGIVNVVVGAGTLSVDKSYTITVAVYDSNDSSYSSRTLNSQKFIIDRLPENKGLAFGKAAEYEGYADFAYKAYHRENVEFLNDKSIIGMTADGEQYNALIPVTASGNTTLGYGLYSAGLGATNIYGNRVNFYTKDGIHANGNHLYFGQNRCLFGTKPDGSFCESLNLQNANGNTVIGYGNYDNASGGTHLYGYDIAIGVSNIATPGTYRPYYRRGDTIACNIQTSGYVTNAKTEIHFMVHLAKPIVGTPSIALTSDDGFVLRQNDKYTHGSSASVHVIPTSYQAYAYHGVGVRVVAVFENTTNAVNNSAIGVHWSGSIVLS